MQLLHVAGFERDSSTEHCVEDNSSAPDVCLEACVALLTKNLGGNVGGGAALLVHDVAGFDQLAHSEVCNFDVSLAIEEDVIELDVSVKNPLAMNVAQAFNDLSEDDLGADLVQLLSLSDVVEQVATGAELHAEQHVALGLEGLVQLDDALVSQSEEDAYFVHDFGFLLLVGHVLLVDALEGNELPAELVHAQADLSEGSSAQHLTSSVELWSGLRCNALALEAASD